MAVACNGSDPLLAHCHWNNAVSSMLQAIERDGLPSCILTRLVSTTSMIENLRRKDWHAISRVL